MYIHWLEVGKKPTARGRLRHFMDQSDKTRITRPLPPNIELLLQALFPDPFISLDPQGD